MLAELLQPEALRSQYHKVSVREVLEGQPVDPQADNSEASLSSQDNDEGSSEPL